jgi:tetratricopeptide (TPR) repeat protein/predicted Ser/Thr protein kinase
LRLRISVTFGRFFFSNGWNEEFVAIKRDFGQIKSQNERRDMNSGLIGLIGGIVGGIIGVAGGLLGTYFSIKNTNGPQERAFAIKASIAVWIFVLAFVSGMCLIPGLYKILLIPIYVVGFVAGILLWNKKQAQICLEESKNTPAVSPTQSISRKCPQCGAELIPDVSEGLCPACLLQRGIATEGGAPPGTPPFTPPTIPDLAKLFPQLEILELIGKGGMGAVYKARQPALDRFVALKILAPRSGGDLDFAERFTREARALARLNHPNIVAVYDFGQAGGLSYFIMEHVDGPNLRQVEQAGRLSPREALEIIPQICGALQFAHDEGIVHRDIKPENVLLDKKGRVKIADFGLAKILGQEPKDFRLTGARDVVGTPHYMAPEQVEKPQEVDHRADIYSLGVVFYEMLTGELPLGKFQPPSSCARGLQIDVRLDEVVLRSLEKEPSRRYQQVSQVKTAVETIATTPDGPAAIQPKEKIMTPTNYKPLWYGLAVGAACLFIVLPASYFLFRSGGNATELTRAGWRLWQAQRWAEAEAKFKKAVKLAPNDTTALNGLGWAAFSSGKTPEAEQAFQKVIALQPDHPAALNGMGQIYLARGDYDQAKEYLLKAAPQSSAAWYGLARLYLLEGKFAEAEKWAQKVVDSGQADEVAKQMLSAAQAKQLSDGLRRMIELRQPATADLRLETKVSYANDRASVQDIVMDLAGQAGLQYNFRKSFAQTDPLCRRWVNGVTIRDKSCREALAEILDPVGLRYKVENGAIVLYRK